MFTNLVYKMIIKNISGEDRRFEGIDFPVDAEITVSEEIGELLIQTSYFTETIIVKKIKQNNKEDKK